MKYVLTVGSLLLSAALGHAQDRQTTTTTTTTTTQSYGKVSAVVGSSVMLQSESLGKVTDIVINDHGCIEYLVVSYGEEYVAVPWGAVRYDVRQETVTVTSRVDRQQLRDLTFSRNNWPNFGAQAWTRNMRNVWGANAFRSESRGGGNTGAARSGGQDTEDRNSGTTPDRTPGSTDKARKDGTKGTGRDEGTQRPGGTDRPRTDKGKGGTDRPRTDTDKGDTDRPRTDTDKGGTIRDGKGREGTTKDRAPGGKDKGTLRPGTGDRNQNPGNTNPGTTTPGNRPGGEGTRGPGVDETRGISNGVNTTPGQTRIPGAGGAGGGGSTTGNTPGPASNPNRNTTPQRPTDRPPQ